MRRLAILLAALILGLPGAAFAQGAGDDQNQDPFGDEPSSQTGGGGGGAGSGDGGLSDEPPVPGGGGSGSSGSDSSGSGTAPSTGGEAPSAPTQAPAALPRTGSEPLMLVGLGTAFLLTGFGLRLRTIDPNAF